MSFGKKTISYHLNGRTRLLIDSFNDAYYVGIHYFAEDGTCITGKGMNMNIKQWQEFKQLSLKPPTLASRFPDSWGYRPQRNKTAYALDDPKRRFWYFKLAELMNTNSSIFEGQKRILDMTFDVPYATKLLMMCYTVLLEHMSAPDVSKYQYSLDDLVLCQEEELRENVTAETILHVYTQVRKRLGLTVQPTNHNFDVKLYCNSQALVFERHDVIDDVINTYMT